MSDLSWNAVKRLVYERAKGCCEYCQSCEEITGQGMHIEHIIPNQDNHPDNLCLSCADCNAYKGVFTTGIDPETGETVALYNPRTQRWQEHFQWLKNGIELNGLTATGKVTIIRLRLNRDRLLRARQRWIEAKLHPPDLSKDT